MVMDQFPASSRICKEVEQADDERETHPILDVRSPCRRPRPRPCVVFCRSFRVIRIGNISIGKQQRPLSLRVRGWWQGVGEWRQQ
jgi:hypothetical protein